MKKGLLRLSWVYIFPLAPEFGLPFWLVVEVLPYLLSFGIWSPRQKKTHVILHDFSVLSNNVNVSLIIMCFSSKASNFFERLLLIDLVDLLTSHLFLFLDLLNKTSKNEHNPFRRLEAIEHLRPKTTKQKQSPQKAEDPEDPVQN